MDTAQRVMTAFYVGCIFGIILLVFFYLSHREVDYGPTRWARWRAALIMWSERRRASRAASMKAVSIPVSQYGMDAAGMEPPTPSAPDMDAVNAGMPRFSRDLSNEDLIVLLALQRGAGGKPRYSANAIHALIGGDRNTVLALIREVRSGPAAPVFPPLTPAQQQQREELGLPAQ